MTFSSSPVLYPASSSPVPVPAPKQKRRLFQHCDLQQPAFKKPRIQNTVAECPVEKEDAFTKLFNGVLESVPSPPIEVEPEDTITPTIEDIDAIEPDLVPSTLPTNLGRGLTKKIIHIQDSSGQILSLAPRKKQPLQTYEQTIANRSAPSGNRAKRAYYGIEIHKLIDDAKLQRQLDEAARETEAQKQAQVRPSIERPQSTHSESGKRSNKHQMWTEKYRAKKFTDLVGDERTHRSVLRWLKAWDTIVFPGAAKLKPKMLHGDKDAASDYQHRKIMLLTGPPGLGKTTLAHVCAKQAGYEVLEINASDDRSRDVVKGRIKDALVTETVRGIQEPGKTRKAGRPVCVVVDEVDGVVTGSAGPGGEGGFIRALIDLVQLDQRNTSQVGTDTTAKGTKKGDKSKLLRPLILICNDLYAPSLRPLRNSSIAEIVHVRKPPIDKVITRLKTVFEKENIRCDNDAVRRLCEDCWGLGFRKQGTHTSRGSGDGDIRGVLVQGEWLAHKLRINNASDMNNSKMTRKWLESQLSTLNCSSNGNGSKGLGRGGTREVVERIFVEGAGLPTSSFQTTLSLEETRQLLDSKTTPVGVADLQKRNAITALREMIETCGDHDRLMTDCFATYPTQVFQDDTFLSKPNMGYDWLYFHDSLSSRVFSGQEWELNPYLSTSACAFHHLFASVNNGAAGWANAHNESKELKDNEEQTHPFSGPKADFAAYEAEKANRTVLTELQSNFSGELLRLFSSTENIATELVPNVNRMLAPDVKPVVVGGSGGGPSVASVRKESERNCIARSVNVMHALGVAFEKVRIETEGFAASGSGGFALRMEPPIDTLLTYHTSLSKTQVTTESTAGPRTTLPKTQSTTQPTRYAVRQVLDQELRKHNLLLASATRTARGSGALTLSGGARNPTMPNNEDKENLSATKPNTDATETKPVGKVKRDFFGRVIQNLEQPIAPAGGIGKTDAVRIAKASALKGRAKEAATEDGRERIWVSYHEGFSNAVRKPINLGDLMDGF